MKLIDRSHTMKSMFYFNSFSLICEDQRVVMGIKGKGRAFSEEIPFIPSLFIYVGV